MGNKKILHITLGAVIGLLCLVLLVGALVCLNPNTSRNTEPDALFVPTEQAVEETSLPEQAETAETELAAEPTTADTDPTQQTDAPSSWTQPASTEPNPTEPAPTEPAPTEPAPTEPAPTEPAPTEPAPTEPAPTEPAPTEPAPTEPAPTEPDPTEPPEEKRDFILLTGKVPSENGIVTEDTTLGEGYFTVLIPAGVQLESDNTTLELTISEKDSSDSGVALEDNHSIKPLDVHIQGISQENTVPVIIHMGNVLPDGMNIGNITIYHVENGIAKPMTQVMGLAEVTAHNDFHYDPVTGDVTVAMMTFSELAFYSDDTKSWEGAVDHSWYDATATELTIANADQLWSLSQIVGGMAKDADDNAIAQDSFAGKTIKLICDININDTTDEDGRDLVFYPIGYYNSEGTYQKTNTAISSAFRTFEGTFDGNGHTISNFYQNTWEMKGDNSYYPASEQRYRDGMGLFGKVYGGTIKNLTVDNFQSDGEYTTTGVIAAYADCGATFENISIINCNPRVYNIGNGGIVGCVGWYAAEATSTPVTFKNITVDNSNTISALWGSWDVACGGIVGQYYPTSGQSSANYPANAGIHMENCHVAAQIDVYNDVCANYQYYAYRYAGMLIGSVRENETIDGHSYPKMDGITASGCTVHFGDWNDYYYCELVANTSASYTHDYQMSRLEQVASVDTENMQVTSLESETTAIPSQGSYNYVVVKTKDDGSFDHATENATCYHFVNGDVWDHKDSGIDEGIDENADGEDDLKEDKQHIYLEFNNLVTGYGWGVTSKGLKDFDGVTNIDIKLGNNDASVEKFASQIEAGTQYVNGSQLTLGALFMETGSDVPVLDAKVQVFVSPVDETNTAIRCIYTPSTDGVWENGTVTLLGEGDAIITITDYFFCTPTTITVTLIAPDCAICSENGAIPWTVEAYTGATTDQIEAGASSVYSGHYYLANDTTLEKLIDLRNANAEVSLCLHGYTLNSPQRARLFRIDNGGKLTVYGQGGTIKPHVKNLTIGTVAYIAANGSSLEIYNCTIDGEDASIAGNSTSSLAGGTIRVQGQTNDGSVASTVSVLLDGVTMKNCKAVSGTNSAGNEAKGHGAALNISSGTVTVKNSTITDCSSVNDGGAILIYGGTLNVENTTISNSSAGGILPEDEQTDAVKYYAGHGGALYITQSGGMTTEVNIKDSEITGCSSTSSGGGIYITQGTLNLQGTTKIYNCVAGGKNEYTPENPVEGKTYYIGNGGAILLQGSGTVNIYDSTEIYQNTSSQEGGAISTDVITSTLNMFGGKIYENTSTNANASCGGLRLNGVFNMSGGEIYNNKGGIIAGTEIILYISGNATFTGGKVYTTTGNNGSILNVYRGEATIYDGAVFSGYCIRVGAETYKTNDADEFVFDDDGGKLYIKGGTFNCTLIKNTPVSPAVNEGVLEITGGNFSTDVSKFAAVGYACEWDAGTSRYVVALCTEHTIVDGICSKCNYDDGTGSGSSEDSGSGDGGDDSGNGSGESETEATEPSTEETGSTE